MKHPVHSINAEGEQCTILNITGKFKESRLMTYDKGKKNRKTSQHASRAVNTLFGVTK